MKRLAVIAVLVAIFGVAGSSYAKDLYVESFSDWRDEGTNQGFNAALKYDKENGMAIITTDENNSYGKVMSPEEPLTIAIDDNTELIVELLNDIPKGDIKVNLMTAGDPYDSHEVISAKSKKGTYTAKIKEKTDWSGSSSFWIEVWLEGIDRRAEIGTIKITDGQEEVIIKKKTKSTGVSKKRKKK